MKKVIFLAIFVLAFTSFWLKKSALAPQNGSVSPSATPTLFEAVKEEDILNFEKDGVTFRAAWAKNSDVNNLFLYPNFKEKLTARELFESKKCRALINAGFYTKEEEPVGLFLSEGKEIKGLVPSKLFDGVFMVDDKNQAAISWEVPNQMPRLALQSGPVLLKDRRILKLEIKDDKSARRSVLALVPKGEVVFLIIFQKDSILEGPLLADLPQVVRDLGEKIGVEFKDAINLDGGSASAFYTKSFSLPEYSSIGSALCFRP